MMKIATHNSVTGEKGRGILSFLVAPFSKCQSKTLAEQFEVGCRYFDIRYKWSDKRKEYVCAHGLWESKDNLHDLLSMINFFSFHDDCYVMMTCESGEPLSDDGINFHLENYPKIKFTSFNVKHPEWKIFRSINPMPHINAYKVLNWDSWHTLLPIPWLWKKIYFDKPEFNEDTFTFVDFL